MSELLPSAFQDCCRETPCCDPVVTTVPGAQGDDGADGTNGAAGENAFTLLDGGFTMPNSQDLAPPHDVVTDVVDNTWMGLNQILFIQSAGYMQVTAINGNGTGVTLENLSDATTGAYASNAAPGAAIPDQSKVSPGGLQGPAGTSSVTLPLAIADGGTGSTTAANARTALGLGTMAVQAASAVAITGGTIAGITDLAVADGGTGASTAANARTNLGLGTIATQAASAVAITGGTIDTTPVGSGTPSTGAFTTLSSSGSRTESGRVIQTPTTLQTLGTASLIQANGPKIRVVSSGGAVTMTSTPTISPGTADGQRLLIKGTSASATIILQDNDSLAGSSLELSAASRTLGLHSQIELSWDSTDAKWCEISFAAN